MSETNKTLNDLLNAARNERPQEFVSANDAQHLVANSFMRDVPSRMQLLKKQLISTPLRLSITAMTSAALITIGTLAVRSLTSSTPQLTPQPQVIIQPQLAQVQQQQPHVIAVAVDTNRKRKYTGPVLTTVRYLPTTVPATPSLAVPATLAPIVSTATPVDITPEQAAEIGIQLQDNGDIELYSQSEIPGGVNKYAFPAAGGIRLQLGEQLSDAQQRDVKVYAFEPRLVTEPSGAKRLFTFHSDSSYQSEDGKSQFHMSTKIAISPNDSSRNMHFVQHVDDEKMIVINGDTLHAADPVKNANIQFRINGPLNTIDMDIPNRKDQPKVIIRKMIAMHTDSMQVRNEISDSTMYQVFRSLPQIDSSLKEWHSRGGSADSALEIAHTAFNKIMHGPAKQFMFSVEHPLDLKKLVPLRVVNDKNPSKRNELIFWYEPTSQITNMLPAAKQSVHEVKPQNLAVQIYPNPTNGPATISYTLKDTAHQVDFVVRNLLGQKVLDAGSSNDSNGNISLDLSKLDAGLYLLVTTTDDGEQSVERIVVNK